jgi:hypothetical protein
VAVPEPEEAAFAGPDADALRAEAAADEALVDAALSTFVNPAARAVGAGALHALCMLRAALRRPSRDGEP